MKFYTKWYDQQRSEEINMENQHRRISGYRELGPDEIEAMNEVKALSAIIGHQVEKLQADPNTDKRWVAIARTQLQLGTMALTRAIAQPTTF